MGGVNGESTHEDHEGQIDILAWSTSVESTGIGRGCSASLPGELVFTKFVDSTTPEIHQLFESCGRLSEVILEVPISGERVMRAYFGPGVRIVAIVAGALGDDGLPTEQATLNYTEVEFKIVGFSRGE